jgi:hypothetical protein
MKRTLIPLLFFCVGIAFTIACAAKPAEIGKWPDTLTIFIIGAVVCTLALTAWRLSIKSGKTDVSGKGSSSTQDLFAKLHECRDFARQIGERFNQLDTNSLCEAIDELLINHMNPFVENRHVLIDYFGMSKGSDILLKTAFAERQFNRVWSASSDHCLPEAKISFELALSAMEDIVDYVEHLE